MGTMSWSCFKDECDNCDGTTDFIHTPESLVDCACKCHDEPVEKCPACHGVAKECGCILNCFGIKIADAKH